MSARHLSRATALALHAAFAAYGFMGMLALGLSYILVPMFALAPAPAERPAWASLAVAALGLLFAGIAALDIATTALRPPRSPPESPPQSCICGSMRSALATGMRHHLAAVHARPRGVGMMVASLVLALVVVPERPSTASPRSSVSC